MGQQLASKLVGGLKHLQKYPIRVKKNTSRDRRFFRFFLANRIHPPKEGLALKRT